MFFDDPFIISLLGGVAVFSALALGCTIRLKNDSATVIRCSHRLLDSVSSKVFSGGPNSIREVANMYDGTMLHDLHDSQHDDKKLMAQQFIYDHEEDCPKYLQLIDRSVDPPQIIAACPKCAEAWFDAYGAEPDDTNVDITKMREKAQAKIRSLGAQIKKLHQTPAA